MLAAMLDANLCIRVLRDRPGGLRERFKTEARNLAISTIVLHELYYGAERSDRPQLQRNKVGDFAAHISVLDFDSAAANEAAVLAAVRQKAGRSVDMRDTQIAGIALARRARLATRNVRHFQDLDVPVVDPWRAG